LADQRVAAFHKKPIDKGFVAVLGFNAMYAATPFFFFYFFTFPKPLVEEGKRRTR
jgi:hypothetical protein